MKYLLSLLFCIAANNISAQLVKYNIGNPWPENGYTFFDTHKFYNVSIHRYADNDTLYYLKMQQPIYRDGYHFLTVSEKVKDSLLISEFNFDVTRNNREYIGYYKQFLNKTQAAYTKNTEWTYYKTENRHTLLTTASAIELYRKQREVHKTKLTPEQYMALIRMFGSVFSVMGAGADTRTQYDKLMQSGGW